MIEGDMTAGQLLGQVPELGHVTSNTLPRLVEAGVLEHRQLRRGGSHAPNYRAEDVADLRVWVALREVGVSPTIAADALTLWRAAGRPADPIAWVGGRRLRVGREAVLEALPSGEAVIIVQPATLGADIESEPDDPTITGELRVAAAGAHDEGLRDLLLRALRALASCTCAEGAHETSDPCAT